MQHVLRCLERQSDGSEYKKTLRRPGLRPDPAEGAYSAPANPLAGGDGLAVASPRTPSPALGPSGFASPTPTPKLVPTPLSAAAALLPAISQVIGKVISTLTLVTAQSVRIAQNVRHREMSDKTAQNVRRNLKCPTKRPEVSDEI